MADPTELFTDPWLAACNDALASLPAPDEDRNRLVVTELVTDAPPGAHRAVTLVADHDGVRLTPGEDAASVAWLTVAYADAASLHAGTLDPARALTEGKVRVRGDLRAVVDAVGLLARAHEVLRTR